MLPLSNSLEVGTYTFSFANGDRNAEIILSGITTNWYGPLHQGDSYTVNITKNEQGLISGTFTAAQFTGTSSLEPRTIQITNGMFQNIRVVE
jgi:hypothetical protein